MAKPPDSAPVLKYAPAGLPPFPSPPAVRKRGLVFIGLAVAGIGFAMAMQGGLNANYLVEVFHITGTQQGVLEACRESCGIIAFGFLAILAGLAEPLVAAIVLVVVAVGLGSYAFAPNYLSVVLMSLVWSQGLHIWMPLPNSMTLSLTEPGKAGHRLGQIQAAGAVGALLGLGAALGLTELKVAIRPQYVLAGLMGVLAAAACLGIPRGTRAQRASLVFRRRYSLYYLLCFLEGWRKQIFIAFAGFLLVKQFGTPLKTMLVLMMIVNGVGYLASPRVGRLIDRVGERAVLVFYYTCLIGICCGYALIPNRHALYGLFVLDSAFFVFGTAQTTFVNRIAPPEEHTATLSMGVAMNHVASVLMPLVGGVLWGTLGYRWTFLAGAVAAMVSVPVAMSVPLRKTATVSG